MFFNNNPIITHVYTDKEWASLGYGMPKIEKRENPNAGLIKNLFTKAMELSGIGNLSYVPEVNSTIQKMNVLIQEELDSHNLTRADSTTLSLYEESCYRILQNIETHKVMVDQFSQNLVRGSRSLVLSSHKKEKVLEHINKIHIAQNELKEAKATLPGYAALFLTGISEEGDNKTIIAILNKIAFNDRKSFYEFATPFLEKIETPHGSQAIQNLLRNLTYVKVEDRKSVSSHVLTLAGEKVDENVLSDLIEGMKTLKINERGEICRYAAPFLKGIRSSSSSFSEIFTVLNSIHIFERERFSSCAIPFLEGMRDGYHRLLILKALQKEMVKYENEEEWETFAKFLLPFVKGCQNADERGCSQLFEALNKISVSERESYSHSILPFLQDVTSASSRYHIMESLKSVIDKEDYFKFVSPFIQGIKDDKAIESLIDHLDQIEIAKREGFSKYVVPYLEGIETGEARKKIILGLSLIEFEGNEESFSAIVDPLLEGVTDESMRSSFIYSLARVKKADRQEIAECVAPLLQVLESDAIALIITKLSKLKAEERKSFVQYAASPLKGIKDAHIIAGILDSLAKVKENERKDFSKLIMPLLQEKPVTRLTVILHALTEVKAQERESLSKHVLTLVKEVEDDLIEDCLQSLAKVKAEARESVSRFAASLLKDIDDPHVISSIIEELANVEEADKESVAKSALPLLHVGKKIEAEFARNMIEGLAAVKVNKRDKVAAFLAPLLKVKEGFPIYALISGLGTVKVGEMENVLKYAAPFLQNIENEDLVNNLFQVIGKIKREDREEFFKYAEHFLLGVNDPNAKAEMIVSLAKIQPKDRENFQAFVTDLCYEEGTRYFFVGKSKIFEALAQVKPEEWGSVLQLVTSFGQRAKDKNRADLILSAMHGAPLLKGITDIEVKWSIIEHLADVKADQRESVAKAAAHLLQGVTEDSIIMTIIVVLENVKADRESVAKSAAALLQGVASEGMVVEILSALEKVHVDRREKVAKFAAPFLLEIEQYGDFKDLWEAIEFVKLEEMDSVAAHILDKVKDLQDKNERIKISIEFLKNHIFVPPAHYDALVAACITTLKEGGSPTRILFSQPEIRNDAITHMLESLKEDDLIQSHQAEWLFRAGNAMIKHWEDDAWDIPDNSDLFKKLQEIGYKFHPSKYVVDYELLKSHPEQILRYMPYKLAEGKYPRINFLENQQISEAIDAGGPKRQLQATLFENLFNMTARDKKLPFHQVVDEEGSELGALPRVRVGQTEFAGDKQSYTTIGQLLAFAFRDVNSLLTGVHLNLGLMEALSTLSEEDMQALSRLKIQNWGDLPESILVKIFAALDPAHAALATPVDEFNEKEKNFYENFMTIWDDNYQQTGKHQSLREAIQHYATDHPEIPYAEIIPAIAIVAQAMYATLGADQWEEINELDAERLSEKTQGLQLQSCEPVISQLIWTGPDARTESGTRTKAFLSEWLHQISLKDLHKFVKAVTGSSTLKNKSKLNMRLYTPLHTAEEQRMFPDSYTYENKLPLSHTCFNMLDLPTVYPTQEIFNRKMEEFMANALFGSGFTVE